MMKDQDKEVEKVVQMYGRIQLKNKLDHIHIKQQRQRRIRWILILLLCCLAILWFKFFDKRENKLQKNVPIAETQKIYEDYFEPYPIQNLRSTDAKQLSVWDTLRDLYQAENFEAFIPFLNQADNENNSVAQLYLASALMSIGNFAEAESILLRLEDSSIYGADAKWYLGLLLLRRGDIEESKRKFQEANNIRKEDILLDIAR